MEKLLIILALTAVAMADWNRPEYVRSPLGDSIDLSTMKVLKESYGYLDDKNIVLSPLGVMILLSLYNEGAGPAASRQLTTFLGGTDAKESAAAFKELNGKLAAVNPDHLSVANKIFVSDQLELSDTFAAAARDYNNEVGTADFSKSEETAAKINQWSAEKTKGHITQPVDPKSLTPDMVAALLNVIFFKGEWHVPFKVEDTKEMDFYLSKNNVTKKEMMHLHQSLYYTESEQLGAKMIELPYKEQGFRMIVVLPNEVDGLPSVLEKVATNGLLTSVYALRPAGRPVDLDIPKFDIRTKLDLNDVLRKVGVDQIFLEPAIGIVKGAGVKVSKVFQEAFIKVNEEGATAGAFTGDYEIAYARLSPLPVPLIFTADHPFVYVILHEDKILFAGVYMVPYSELSRPPQPIQFTVDHPFLYVILHEDRVLFAGTYSG